MANALIGNQAPMVVNPHLFEMRHDPAEALDPIAMIADAQLVIVVGPRLPVKTLPEFLEKAKSEQLVMARPGTPRPVTSPPCFWSRALGSTSSTFHTREPGLR